MSERGTRHAARSTSHAGAVGKLNFARRVGVRPNQVGPIERPWRSGSFLLMDSPDDAGADTLSIIETGLKGRDQ